MAGKYNYVSIRGVALKQRLQVQVLPTSAASEPPSRIQSILSSTAPIYFVVSGNSDSPSLSFATRVVHDLNLFHKLDAEIIFEQEASFSEDFSSATGGHIVYIGNLTSPYIRKILEKGETPFKFEDSQLYLNGTPVITFGKGMFISYEHASWCQRLSTALLFAHPLPRPAGFMLFIICSDLLAYERARRLFPIRTGVTVPSWIIIGEQTDSIGAAGVEAAGYVQSLILFVLTSFHAGSGAETGHGVNHYLGGFEHFCCLTLHTCRVDERRKLHLISSFRGSQFNSIKRLSYSCFNT